MIKRFINFFFGKTDNDSLNVPVVKLKKDDIISFKAGLDLTELPIVTLSQGDKKFNFLLDTGSNNSIIDKSALPHIEHTLTDMTSNVFGVEGKPVETNICIITLSFNSLEYTFEYVINDMSDAFKIIKKDTGVTLHGIIGSKFFNKFKYVLDFDELIAYSKK